MPNKENAQEKPKTEAVREEKKAAKQADPVYSAKDLADAAGRMGTRKECVLAALREAGVQACTFSAASKIVEGYLKKEVK